MADNGRNNQVKEITKRLEQGVKDLFESEKYMLYLKTMSRFHQYSTRNTLLIHMQKPDATLCCGYQAWQSKFGRYVKKGEKGIQILAPVPFSFTEERQKLDPDTRKPILDATGAPVIEEVERRLARFKVAYVYDVSQTDGKPLPSLADDLTGDVRRYELFMDALKAVSPLPVVFEPLNGSDGECRFGDKIAIREGMSEIQTVSAVVHEIAHAELHDIELLRQQDETAKPKDRRTEEVEAESVSYAVCQYYNIETGANSFGYLAEWSKTRELKELNASLETIRKAAADLIDNIDKKYRALAQEHGIDLTGELPSSEPSRERFVPTVVTASERMPVFHETRDVGETVLMPLVYDEHGNLERTDKRTRVTIEPPVGKYAVYSRENGDSTEGYVLTDSGKLIYIDEYKHMSDLSEANLNESFANARSRVERFLHDPGTWVDFSDAAIANRIAEAERHNAPIREAREAEYQAEARERIERRQAERQEHENAFNASADEISEKLIKGESVDVTIDRNLNKNPLFTLFARHKVDLPLATKGWINRNLKSFQLHADGRVTMWLPKGVKPSETFANALSELKDAIEADRLVERGNAVEHINYQKLAELFPQVASGEYRYLRLEAGGGMEPLTLERIGADTISVMHSYAMNGDFMYDPMITFKIDGDAQTLTAFEFEQSMPPIYQRVNEDGNGLSIDGNGRQTTVLRLREQIGRFASQWLDDVKAQGYIPVRANMEIDGEDTRIEFDSSGVPIVTEQQPGHEKWSEPATTENAPHEPGVPSDDVSAYLPETHAIADKSPEQSTPFDVGGNAYPDPSISLSERDLYGYTGEDMLPLTQARALELFEADHTIYMLYDDNTEAMVFDREEIITFATMNGGIFGIDADEWRESPEYNRLQAERSEGTREAMLLYGEKSAFGIYQVKEGDELRYHRFSPLEQLEKDGLTVERDNYELVYTGTLDIRDKLTNLGKIQENFNIDHPADFTGRSVSVSDVIVLQWRGEVSSHYVDSIGFKELPAFLGQEQISERETSSQLGNMLEQPETTGPTVAELKAEVDAGRQISLTELANAVKSERGSDAHKQRPSVLAQLREYKNSAAQGADSPKTAPKHDANREV